MENFNPSPTTQKTIFEPPHLNTTLDNPEINATFQLLAEGEEKIELNPAYKNLTLLFGNTGAGKSTFIQWLAGDNSKLISREVGTRTGKFLIEDGNRIGSSINSKTIFPELVVDDESNAFYDCPGFSDTRSACFDIAATYFIKKLTDHAENVKIILIVGYPSVSEGVDRQDFINLLRHATDLIKNIDNFKESITIAVTKVDNNYIKEGRSLNLVTDENIIGSIAGFFQKVKRDLEDRSKLPDISPEEMLFCNNALKLVDIFSEQKKQNYSRIAIFRRPDEPGPIGDLPLLQEGKEHVKKILNEELKFSKINDNDFGYTISERSKNVVNDLVERINDKVWADILEIVQKIKSHYSSLFDEINNKIKTFDRNSDFEGTPVAVAQNYSEKLNIGKQVLAELKTENLNVTDLGIKINNSTTLQGVESIGDTLKRIPAQGRYLEFLQVVSKKELNSRPWSELFEKIYDYFCNEKKNIEKGVLQTAQKKKEIIHHHIEKVFKEIEILYEKRFESLEISALLDEVKNAQDYFENLTKQIKSNVSTVEELSERIRDTAINLNLETPDIKSRLSKIRYNGGFLQFLNILNDRALVTWSVSWADPINNVGNFLSESGTWFTFLQNLYKKLSEYDVQENTAKYNVANVEDWGKPGRSQGIKIDRRNLNSLLGKVKEYSHGINASKVTDLQLSNLGDVFESTVKKSFQTSCSELGKLIIEGDFIKFSDFISNDGTVIDLCKNNKANLNSVDIFSANTVFIDRDIQESSKNIQMSVIAPTWKIIGDRKINLNGATGVPHVPDKAQDGYSIGSKGGDGLPGLPGSVAGDFMGIGLELVSGNKLTILVNGGQGGPGQHGGAGGKGADGFHADTSDYFQHEILETLPILTLYYNHVTTKYIYYGKAGSVGGNGGDGGIGGLGGMGGEIKLAFLNKYSGYPYTQRIQGSVGVDGNGGIGGEGGLPGNDLEAFYCVKTIGPLPVHLSWCGRTPKSSNMNRASSGWNGEAGRISDGRKLPHGEKAPQDIPRLLSSYKNYLQNQLTNKFQNRILIDFSEYLDGLVIGNSSGHGMLEKSDKGLHRMRRQYPDISSSAQRPTSWISNVWKGLSGIFSTDTKASLPQPPVSLVPSTYTADYLQGGLVLLDLLVRKWTGEKYLSPKFLIDYDMDESNRTMAHELAYGIRNLEVCSLEATATEILEPSTTTPQEPLCAVITSFAGSYNECPSPVMGQLSYTPTTRQ